MHYVRIQVCNITMQQRLRKLGSVIDQQTENKTLHQDRDRARKYCVRF